MKKLIILCSVLLIFKSLSAQKYVDTMPPYAPTQINLDSRKDFQDRKFGLFIHWGIYSTMASGEWVMFNNKIEHKAYQNLAGLFKPVKFNAKEWVALAKATGMKYITITSRHHDGFSMFKSNASSYNVVDATPYGKDVIKQLAEECQKEGLRLHIYYSLLDWGRPDYGFKRETVNGKPLDTDWDSYISFMKNQLTELLTNYPNVDAIWFDGWWDKKDANWNLHEIYTLIHKLRPQTLVGNNHHIKPLPGEDFQMFEKDLPGANKGGFSKDAEIGQLPLETCETMNNSWGYNVKDLGFKSSPDLIRYLVNAAGHNANFLLNVGPMPDGRIQPEFVDTLKKVGDWMKIYGETIYGTRGNVIPSQNWGTATYKEGIIYLHILNSKDQSYVFVPGIKGKVKAANMFVTNKKIEIKQVKDGLFVYLPKTETKEIDTVVMLKI